MATPRPKVPIRSNLLVKWPGGILDEGFVPFPKRLLRCLNQFFDSEKGIAELRVLLAVADFKRNNPTLEPELIPTAEQLAFIAGMEVNDFVEGLGRLYNNGLVTVRERNGGLTIDHSPFCKKVVEITENPSATITADKPWSW